MSHIDENKASPLLDRLGTIALEWDQIRRYPDNAATILAMIHFVPLDIQITQATKDNPQQVLYTGYSPEFEFRKVDREKVVTFNTKTVPYYILNVFMSEIGTVDKVIVERDKSRNAF